MPAGKRVRRARGIYEDAIGLQAMVKGGRGPENTRRFPKGKLKEAKRWQRDRLAELAKDPQPKAPSQRGTLRAEIPRRLSLIPEGPQRERYDAHLAPWLETSLADARRTDIIRVDVKQQLATWLSEGYAASTVNKRLSALRGVYRELDSDTAPDPTRGIKKFKEPEPEPRGITFALAEQILARIQPRRSRKLTLATRAAAQAAALAPGANYRTIARDFGISDTMVRKLTTRGPITPDDDTAAQAAQIRLRLILYTGLPHAQVMRLRPEHVDWDLPSLLTTARRKGAGAPAVRLPLIPQAVDALRAFDAANLYGAFDASQARHYWDRARDAVAKTIENPALRALVQGLRPYDLRHTFLTELYRHSGDHRAVREMGLHRDDRTTDRYTLAAVSERAAKAAAALAAATQIATPVAASGVEKNTGKDA